MPGLGLILWYISNGKGTWNVRSLCRAGSLTTAARELARYKIDSIGVLEDRGDKRGAVKAGDCFFFL